MGVPVGAYLADRYDPRRVLLGASVIYGAAMLGVSQLSSSSAGLLFYLGIMGGIGFSGVSLALVMGAVGRLVPGRAALLDPGVITAGASVGMFLMVPVAQFGLEEIGWRRSYALVAVSGLLIGALAFVFPGRGDNRTQSEDAIDEPFVDTLRKARRNRSYLLLTSGFFVCGFHVRLHRDPSPRLPDRQRDKRRGGLGLSGDDRTVQHLRISLLRAAGRHLPQAHLALPALRHPRPILMIGLLLAPLTPVTAILFGAAMGSVWLGRCRSPQPPSPTCSAPAI